MGVKWTEEQQRVIDLRNCNILVSAAAGSGKTAVLVERIIRRLTDETAPADVDRLLIVTFTEAAAAEMKERIGAAVEKKLSERPGDAHLERQATLIHSAQITTIHSFCLSVIRDHFHVIGIDPGFRIAEEGELKLLKQDVLDEMLEQEYAAGDEKFLEFVEKFGTGRNDRKIEELILNLYEYSRSYPRPGQWLASCVEAYRIDPEQAEEAEVTVTARQRVLRKAEDILGILERARKICEEPDGPYMYADMIESDMREAKHLLEAETYDGMKTAAEGFVWKRLSAKKDPGVSEEKKTEVKELRDTAKKLLKELQAVYFFAPLEVWTEDMRTAGETMETLVFLVNQFAGMLSEKKQSRNMIDFGDMEQFALAILTQEEDGRLVPSPVAAEYQDRFDEVMIDEYQDSNLVQEAILTSVSKVSRGTYNIFMVGDVKQSIYRFRLSRPELFMEKYNTYSLEGGDCQRIDLHRNFRSREEVLDSVNQIFRKIMRKELGGIEYDDTAALYPGAKFPELPQMPTAFTDRTELLLMDKDEIRGEDERRAEARMIACRIRELIAGGVVLDKETGQYRRIRYRDIVILTRSIQGWAESFSAVLGEEGIPAYSVSREGYFETYEVSVLLDYLKILDNARQDLPLAAVLTSPFAGLDSMEMAQIRLAFPNAPFYEAAVRYAAGEDGAPCSGESGSGESGSGESGSGAPCSGGSPDGGASDSSVSGSGIPCGGSSDCGKIKLRENLRTKLAAFYEQAAYFRAKVPYTAIHDLLTEIIDSTGYGTFILAMPGGEQRRANVEMLVEKAAAFEGTSYKGLFNFVRYIEQLKKYDVDYGEAGIMDEQADTVRIMSIHKSKGLEFPVVFAAGMGKRFNTRDSRGNIVIHPELGVGIDAIDLETRTKAPTFLKKIIQEETGLENLAEELRILYVALTRAKEKLIMTGMTDGKETERILKEKESGECERNQELGLYQLEGARSYLDWILPAAAGEDFLDKRIFTPEDLEAAGRAEEHAEALALDVLTHWDESRCFVPELRKSLREQMDYEYAYRDEGKLKLKFTVSELKKRAAHGERMGDTEDTAADEVGEEMYAEPDVVPLIPDFLREEETLTGASRGSAYHKLLELLDFSREYDENSLGAAIEELRGAGKLSEDMAECIRLPDILSFLHCGSGRRMTAAAGRGQLFKEQPFVLGVDAGEIYPGETAEDMILVQGIIDVYFEEPDGLVVLDYKTDKVRKASELTEKYHAQLDYYGQALERLLQKPVKEKIIYSFTLKEEIKL
ncbi:helicase-exonuclease AddAB subunit AddA [Lachnoclostridium sp. An169]|uniref:UvrD-helicase domain-containing protein n=1 Tax=Lachnoclostridium sp. An169 TaxID=1965569 RepID=UPI000B39F370|nr:UvrD-helicase domain-containing protein [Lachnoclostridium sp. An169]OUP83465.1 helicase-exonuclease AddAB subunit AddA [Lachnoclostridium sp. An169]